MDNYYPETGLRKGSVMRSQSRRHSPSAREQEILRLAHAPAEDRWLFFDARGKIGHCSAALARLLDRDPALVECVAIKEVLPDLPVTEATPGYNVAMLTMNYLRRQLHLQLNLGDGRRVPVTAKISSTQLGAGPVFIVELQTCPVAFPVGG